VRIFYLRRPLWQPSLASASEVCLLSS